MAKPRLLQDQFPSHYMPGVGRQVMAEGGGINLPYDADKEPYGAGGLPYGGGKTPYSRKKPHKDNGGAVMEPEAQDPRMEEIVRLALQIVSTAMPQQQSGPQSAVPEGAYADGGAAPSAAITGPHTITADDLIGRASYSSPSQGAYTDAGGQKIAAPYVTSMKNGYPVYSAPAGDNSAFDPMSILSSIFGGKSYGGNNAISNALNVAQSITPYTKVA